MERIKSALLATALALYNAGIFVALNVLLWKNHIWNKKKWTKPVMGKA